MLFRSRRVFISLGAEGVFAADRSGRVQLPCLPAELVNATGCGDAFMAAIAWAYLQGTDLEDTARAGLAASSIAMESGETINPHLSEEALQERQSGMRNWELSQNEVLSSVPASQFLIPNS